MIANGKAAKPARGQVWKSRAGDEWRQVTSVDGARVSYVVRRAPVGRFSMQIESADASAFASGFRMVKGAAG